VFSPDTIKYNAPEKFGLKYQDVFLTTPDNLKLHGWFLSATIDLKGTVFFLHGNGQNISAYIHSVYWLPKHGYNVFMIDYQGYGQSEGSPTYQGAIKNINTGITWLKKQPQVQRRPIYLLGQSLGASLGICFFGSNTEARDILSGVILDAGFSNLRTIVREKFRKFILTWPFNYPISLLFTDKFNPEKYIQNISPVPVLIMHSDEDKVVPSSHSKRLFNLARSPKYYKKTRNGHVTTFNHKDYRQVLLDFMAQSAFILPKEGE
jgi:alpha-beta hydrolase superfamily lysophospholipase